MKNEWTAEDLSVAMLQYSEDQSWGGWGFFAEYLDDQSEVEIGGFGTVVGVEIDSGREGHGEDIFMVFKVEDRSPNSKVEDRYFRIQGAYYSYDGSNWDGPFTEVKATQKMVTVYE